MKQKYIYARNKKPCRQFTIQIVYMNIKHYRNAKSNLLLLEFNVNGNRILRLNEITKWKKQKIIQRTWRLW